MAEGKSKKAGRKKNSSLAYKSSGRRDFNKARRMMKYLRRKPEDVQCLEAFEVVAKRLFGTQRSQLGVPEFLKEFGA